MSSQVASMSLKEAIVDSVERGAYPDSEAVSSAELPASVLPDLLADLEKARDEVKADIRQLSREVAPDVDGWIAQAKKLQADIEQSKITARDIVQQAEAGKKLKAEAEEASNKAGLLEKEVAFNDALVQTLVRIKTIKNILNECQDAMIRGDLASALSAIKQADADGSQLALVKDTRAFDLLQTRSQDLRVGLAEQATREARELVKFNVKEHSLITTSKETSGMQAIEVAVDALSFLHARDSYLQRLTRDLDMALIQPRITTGSAHLGAIKINGDTIYATRQEGDTGVLGTLDDVWSILEFLNTHLPPTLCSPWSEIFLPPLIDKVMVNWLNPCVPVQVDEMPFFQRVLDRVVELAGQIDALKWSATSQKLKEWVQSAPGTWLAKRRETALGSVRTLLFTKLRETKTVERVETQMVSRGDALMEGGNSELGDDAWDEEWGEEESTSPVKESFESKAADDDDDASAWDMDDDQADKLPEPSLSENKTDGAEEDNEADAWGWGDEDQAAQQMGEADTGNGGQHVVAKKSPAKVPVAPAEREVTLKETYTVTAVPDGILEIIEQCVADAETLADPSYAHTPIGPAASGLYTLPTFALAMYRATASTAYGRLDTGKMLVYNDSTRLADQLRGFIAQQAEKESRSTTATGPKATSRLRLDNEIKALDTFAKRAYSTEMESQRMILRDMLDGAQGFANCTTEPFASACESAVDITAARLRDVDAQWKPILSRSALLQSLGSLLSTVTSKVILDIEDLSDIGEEESKKLRSFCDKLSEVKELFVQEHPDGQTSDTTGIYCPNWFKFQYLAEILESSLADIKYLWTEGELRLEFDAEEVVDLIQALFADSEHRRKAIAEIRRASR